MDLYYSQKTWNKYKNILSKHSSLDLKSFMSDYDITFNNLLKQLDILLFSNSPYKFYKHKVGAIHMLDYELSIHTSIESPAKYEPILFVASGTEELATSKREYTTKILSENVFNKVLDIIDEFLNDIADKIKTTNNTIDSTEIEEILLTYLDSKIYKFDFDEETDKKVKVIFSYKRPQKGYEEFGYVGALTISADKFGYYIIRVAAPLCGASEYKIKPAEVEEEIIDALRFLEVIKK